VSIFRAKQKKLTVPWLFDGEPPEVLDELPEKDFKGKALKNNVKSDSGPPAFSSYSNANIVRLGTKVATSAAVPVHYRYVPIDGPNGQATNFIFRYRDRSKYETRWNRKYPLTSSETLQIFGCIPRSPSPEPDAAAMLQRTEDMLRLSKQKGREQNLRILALEVSLFS